MGRRNYTNYIRILITHITERVNAHVSKKGFHLSYERESGVGYEPRYPHQSLALLSGECSGGRGL